MIGVGLTVVFGVMRIINLAHGDLVMLGMYGAFWSHVLWRVDPFLSLVIWVPLMFLGGMLLYRFLLRPIVPGGELNTLLYTAGLSLLIANLALFSWTGDYRTIKLPYAITPLRPFGIAVPIPLALAFALAAVITLALYLFLARTDLGRAIRATSQNAEAAALMGIVAVVLILMMAPPLVTTNQFLLHLAITVLLWTLLGASWNLLGGFAGQVSFGHATFFGVGAYATMILYLRLGLAPWYGMALGGAAAVLVSLPIGLICFRLRGPYFSLSTLAVAEIVRLVSLNWEALTNGPVGLLITALPPVALGTRGINWESKVPFYCIIAVLAALAMAATWILSRARLGAYLLAIREDEDAAESVGIDTVRAKVLTLALSAFFTGLAGGFYGLYFRYVDPDAVFPIALSVEMVFIAVVGGLATVIGPVIGAVFLTTIGEMFRERFLVGHLIFYGLFMMLVIRYLPEGIWGGARRAWAKRP